MFEQLKREVDACEKIIKVQKENKEKLINCIKKLKKQNKDAENEKKLIKVIEERFVEPKIEDLEEEHQKERISWYSESKREKMVMKSSSRSFQMMFE